ncbi:MAG: 5' nucleotidase, NT5C type [Bacillota bacterium]
MAILGFDIDGVLTDEGNYEENIWHQYIINHFGANTARVKNTYNFYEAYNVPAEKLDDFFAEYKEEIFSSVEPFQEAIDFLQTLKQQGHKIILITARDEKFRQVTETWLKKHGFPFDKLYHAEDKAPLAQKEDIKLFVDDNKDNAQAISEKGIPVLLFNREHNQDADSTCFKARVNNWQEIKEFIYDYSLR